MLTSQISKLGRSGVRFISAVGRATIMLFHALAGRPQPRKHFPLLVQQLYGGSAIRRHHTGVRPLHRHGALLQGYNVLKDFGAEQSLGPLGFLSCSVSWVPVVTALLFAGRAGSALTAGSA